MHVFETGAKSHKVNNALLCLQSTGEIYPPKRYTTGEMKLLLIEYPMAFGDSMSSAEIVELTDLWNEWAVGHNEELKASGIAHSLKKELEPYICQIIDENEALGLMTAEGDRLLLPKDAQFSTKCYASIKDKMIKAGGKYIKNGFTFKDKDAQAIKDRLLAGEEINDKKKYQAFFTPEALARELVAKADLRPGQLILEPSAGDGALLNAIDPDLRGQMIIQCYELQSENVEILKANGYNVIGFDFIETANKTNPAYDRILMNPPFTKGQDVRHVLKAYEHLRPGGLLVAIMAKGWTFNTNKASKAFREFIEERNAEVTDIEAGAFKESGTQVATVMVSIRKPRRLK